MNIEQMPRFEMALVKIYFKSHDSRYPMIGSIVYLSDGKELADKKMVRFIREDKLEDWDGFSIASSKIYVVSDFKMIELNGKQYL